MKVITLVDKPVPSERPTGIGVAAFNLALALSKRGVDVHYVCRGAVEETVALTDHLTVQTIRNYSRDNVRVALDSLRKDAPDIVHVHSTAALPSLFLGRVIGRAVAMHSHGDEPLHPLKLALMRKAGMILSQRVIAVSEATRDDIIRTQHLSPKKLAVVYNGVRVEDFRPLAGPTHVLQKYGLEGADKNLALGRRRPGEEGAVDDSKLLARDTAEMAWSDLRQRRPRVRSIVPETAPPGSGATRSIEKF